MDLSAIQRALREQHLDGWLFYDHHRRDELAYSILGLPADLHVTRRWFYLIPASGEPLRLNHRVEPAHLASLPGRQLFYGAWGELHRELASMLAPYKRVAMQYSPNNDIPYISLVDAGMLELIRSFGVELCTSADLVALFEATLGPEQIASHFAARDAMDRILIAAFQEIGRRVRHGGWDEWGVRQWLGEAFGRERLVTDDLPIVGVNRNSGDPHYEPTAERTQAIREGDFLLLDMWAKLDSPGAVYYDITWTGVLGQPNARQQEIFGIVRDARQAAFTAIAEAFAAGRAIAGCEADQAARALIERAGYGSNFVHRTGHSIGVQVHGNGANLDSLETRDSRRILDNTLFSIEPGIYLPDFGVRSEVDCLVEQGRPRITGAQQQELVIF